MPIVSADGHLIYTDGLDRKRGIAFNVEPDLMKIIPRERWILFSHQIIHHGRALCVARKPKCGECKLNPVCYAPDKTVDLII